MRAKMDERVDLSHMPQPEIESDIGVTRRALNVVIGLVTLRARAAIGLQRDDELAGFETGKAKGAVDDGRIILRRAPGVVDARDESCGEG